MKDINEEQYRLVDVNGFDYDRIYKTYTGAKAKKNRLEKNNDLHFVIQRRRVTFTDWEPVL